MRWVRRIISTEALERVSCKDEKRCAEIGTFETYKELQLLIMMRSTTRLREQAARQNGGQGHWVVAQRQTQRSQEWNGEPRNKPSHRVR